MNTLKPQQRIMQKKCKNNNKMVATLIINIMIITNFYCQHPSALWCNVQNKHYLKLFVYLMRQKQETVNINKLWMNMDVMSTQNMVLLIEQINCCHLAH